LKLILRKTINHRRLVVQLYEDRTLHRLAGVEPRMPAVPSPITNGNGRHHEAAKTNGHISPKKDNSKHNVKEDPHRDAETSDPELPQQELEEGEELEDAGRYGIQRESGSRKRQRTDITAHTVFTTDDEDDSDSQMSQSDANSDADAESEHDNDVGFPEKVTSEEKRSYWSSKGDAEG
jgi:non-canonical poly(A) RNA polymerase PAPD5/7